MSLRGNTEGAEAGRMARRLAECRRSRCEAAALMTAVLLAPGILGSAAQMAVNPAGEDKAAPPAAGPTAAAAGGSGPTEFLFRSWQTEDGLPQNSVSAIAQTPDGYLWLGTFNGLARFDGARFTVFTSANSPGLLSDNISSLLVDRAGRLLIGTDGGGLCRYAAGVFTAVTDTNWPATSFVYALAEDAKGTIWVGTPAGLYYLAGERFERVREAPRAFVQGQITDVQPDSTGGLWVAAETEIACFRDGKATPFPGHKAGRLCQTRSGGMWGGGYDSGLSRYESSRWTSIAGFEKLYFNRLYLTRNGDLWMAHDTGLARWSAGQRTDFNSRNGLSHDSAIAVFEDQEGNLWVGTNGGGLNRLRAKRLQTIDVREGLFGNDVVCLLEDRRGRVWVGTYGQGVCVWEAGRARRVQGLPGEGRSVVSLCEGGNGAVLMGTVEGRLVTWQDGRVSEEDLRAEEGARVIFEDREGGLWLGSRRGGVECRREGKTTRYGRAEGLSHEFTTCIAQDRQGTVWVGTKRGLNRLAFGRVEQFSTKDGLRADCIHTLYVDAEGVLWVGTVGGGLSCFREGKFATITSQHGLPNDVIAQIIEDQRGDFWIGSNAGLCRAKRSDLLDCAQGRARWLPCLTFDRGDGMGNPECAGSFQPACFRARDGRLWFATVGGIALVTPEQVAPNLTPPPVHIESVMADRKACHLTPASGASPAAVTVPPGTARVEIAYTGLSYAAPSRVRFRFRLAGIDRDWVEAGMRRMAIYTRPPLGQHRFEVIACNNDGVWSKAGASVAVQVLPAWWQTWGFRLGVGLVAAGTAAAAYCRHLQRLRRERAREAAFARRLLESQEAERKRIAGELHDELGQELLIIKNRAARGLKTPEDGAAVREQLEEISATATQALKEVRSIARALRPAQLERLGLTTALRSLAEQVTAATGLKVVAALDNVDGLFPPATEINLYRVVQEAINNALKHSHASLVGVTARTDGRTAIFTVEDNGVGFDPSAPPAGEASSMETLGLPGMQERARLLGAQLEIVSRAGHGARIELRAPVPADKHAAKEQDNSVGGGRSSDLPQGPARGGAGQS